MYRIYISHPSRVWRNTSYYSLLHCAVLKSYFGTCVGCSNLMCNETITSQLVIDSHSDQFLECIQMKVCSWHIFDRQKSLNEKKGDWAAINYLLISCTRICDLRKNLRIRLEKMPHLIHKMQLEQKMQSLDCIMSVKKEARPDWQIPIIVQD